MNTFAKSIENIIATTYGSMLVALMLVGCNGYSSNDTKANEEKDKNVLSIDSKQLSVMNITTDKVMYKKIKPTVFATGKITPLPNLMARVSSTISGKVERIYVLEGSYVTKGQALLEISSMQLIQLQQDYLTAKSELVYLAQEYSRQTRLKQSNVGSMADFQLAESKYNAALSMTKSLQAKLTVIGLDTTKLKTPATAEIKNIYTVTAPITGYIYELPVTLGVMTSPELYLATIIDLHELHAEVYLYEKDIDKVSEGQDVNIEFVNKKIPGTVGKIQYISKSINQDNRAVTLHVRFQGNKDMKILPEMSINAMIEGNGDARESATVPPSAVFEESGEYFVFVKNADTKDGKASFTKVKVNKGRTTDTYSEISAASITAETVIAVTGVAVLDAELKRQN